MSHASGKRCHLLAKAGCYNLRALWNNYTRPFAQTQERQDVYPLLHQDRVPVFQKAGNMRWYTQWERRDTYVAYLCL